MTLIRRAAVAGTWYPGAPDDLARAVDEHLARAPHDRPELDTLVAIVAPHAGLMYSGAVAACAYRAVSGRAFDVIVLVGPSHFVPFEGVAVHPSGGFETPLGVIAVDEACASALMRATPAVRLHPLAHVREHSLEMQLPFVQRVAPEASIVPLVMGRQTADTARALADALGAVLMGRRALLVASSDLSHYHDASVAVALDRVVVEHVSRLDPDGLQRTLDARPDHACGGGPMVAVLRAARLLGAREARIAQYADSGDVSGDKSAVVGYMAAVMGH